MTTDAHHLHKDLDDEECWRLFRSAETGRIAFGDESDGPIVEVLGDAGATGRRLDLVLYTDDVDRTSTRAWSYTSGGERVRVENHVGGAGK